ncbi:MAG: hypothetical protein PHU81_00960 [Acidobacteriota bacterium]|nr:hypothetical protein [Acidobacteriota bacterium]
MKNSRSNQKENHSIRRISVQEWCFLSFFLVLLFGSSVIYAQQGYLNFSYWNRSRLYSVTGPYYFNEYENILHLDLYQKTLNYGNFTAWFDGRLSSGQFEAAHWYLNWKGFQAGKLTFNLTLGDHNFQFTNLGYRFTNYYPAYNYLRGITAGFQHKKFGLDFISGKVARLTGLLGNFYSLTDQTATGFLGHFETEDKYYLGFGFLHSENEKSWSGELLTRNNDILMLESELRFNEGSKLVMDTRASFTEGGTDPAKITGTSIRFGQLINRNRWSLEINYRRVDAEYRDLNSEFVYDRDQEGLFTSWRYQPWRPVFLFGSFDYYHNNVNRLPELNTTDFYRVYSGFSLISPPWPELTFRLDFSAAESRRQDENYRSFLSPGFYLQLAKKFGEFYPYLRVNFHHYNDRVENQRDFTYPSYYFGLRYNYQRSSYFLIEVEDSRYYDYLKNRTSTLDRLRLAHYSPFFMGTDIYAEVSYQDSKSWYFTTQSRKGIELYLGLGRILPWGIRARLDLRTSWPLQSNQPANYWLTLKLDRRFNWGEMPVYHGRTPGPVLTGTGKIDGLIFCDENLNGVYDEGDRSFSGIDFRLEDGSSVSSNQEGHFLFDRVPEGLHTISLDVRNIPAQYYLLSPERQMAVVEKRKTSRINYLLLEGATISGMIFEDVNQNNLLDEQDLQLKDVLVILRAVKEEELAEAIEQLRSEELTSYTDEKGQFVFENILPGSYELFIDEETLPRGIKLHTELPLKVKLKPGEIVSTLTIMYLPRPVVYSNGSLKKS